MLELDIVADGDGDKLLELEDGIAVDRNSQGRWLDALNPTINNLKQSQIDQGQADIPLGLLGEFAPRIRYAYFKLLLDPYIAASAISDNLLKTNVLEDLRASNATLSKANSRLNVGTELAVSAVCGVCTFLSFPTICGVDHLT
jgi:hypothetical protein